VLTVNPVISADKEPAVSTEGIENLDEGIANSKPDTEYKNEQKQQRNRSKKYMKYKNEIKKQNIKRDKAQKELEYLEKRLENKQQRVDSLSDEEKGE
jgi:uncharacterized membrane protein YgaE (UPF0421/DUF939 family)